MPFKKLNVREIIDEKIKDDKFATAYSEVEKEYQLIRNRQSS